MSYTFSFNVTPPTGFSINAQTGLITIAATAAPFTGSLSVKVFDGVTNDIKTIPIVLSAPTITPLITQLSENMAICGEGFTTIEFLQDSGAVVISGGIATGTVNVATTSTTVVVTGPLVTTSTVAVDGNASIVAMGPLITTSTVSAISVNASTAITGPLVTTSIVAVDGNASIVVMGQLVTTSTFDGGTPGASGSDNFSNATIIPATCSPATQSLVNTGSNVGYTKEANELPTNTIYQKTVWFKFTAPSTTSYNFKTVGSSFDTLLAVFSGTILTNLVLLASDDDSGGSNTSLLNVNLTSGQQYYIQVSGYDGASGNYTLTTSYTCV